MRRAACSALFMVAACGTSSPGGLLTSGMSALMLASAPGNGTTTVAAELFSGSPNQRIYVQLDAEASISATADGQTMPLAAEQGMMIISYQATLASATPGEQYTVSLVRTTDGGAPSSTATLPDAFTLAALPASPSRAADLTITWSPSGTTDLMQWEALGDCITDTAGAIDGDPGTYTIAAGTLVQAATQTSTTCSVTLQLARIRTGLLDSHFGDGGTIAAQQARSAAFTSTP
jgi:hypothetical protein